MAWGVEGIGHLVAVIDQQRGISDEQLAHIGRLLAYLGKALNCHRDMVGSITDDLARGEVVK